MQEIHILSKFCDCPSDPITFSNKTECYIVYTVHLHFLRQNMSVRKKNNHYSKPQMLYNMVKESLKTLHLFLNLNQNSEGT